MLPPEIKRLETALKSSGLKVDQDAETLAFAAFRAGDGTRIVGIAQGQFHTGAIMASFTKNKTKAAMIRNNAIYPLGSSGMRRLLPEPDDDGVWRPRGREGCARRT